MPILSALVRAMRDLGQPRILAVLFLPMLGAIILWSVLGWFFWDTWTEWFRATIDGTSIGRWLLTHGASWVSASVSVVFVFALLLPGIFITAIVITELVAMPVIVALVGRSYPQLARRNGGSLLGSLANAIIAIAIFALLWLATLPLWLTGIGAVVLPALTSAYLNQRLFRYDALAEHASGEEYRDVVSRTKRRLYVLGLLLALLYYIPFVNLVAPVVSGLAFTHFCLAELALLRNATRTPHG